MEIAGVADRLKVDSILHSLIWRSLCAWARVLKPRVCFVHPAPPRPSRTDDDL